GDVIDLGERDTRFVQAVVDRVERQLPGRERNRPLAVLDAREALFLGGGDDLAVDDERRRGIVEGGIDAEGDHRGSSASRVTGASAVAGASSSIAASATASGATRR